MDRRVDFNVSHIVRFYSLNGQKHYLFGLAGVPSVAGIRQVHRVGAQNVPVSTFEPSNYLPAIRFIGRTVPRSLHSRCQWAPLR